MEENVISVLTTTFIKNQILTLSRHIGSLQTLIPSGFVSTQKATLDHRELETNRCCMPVCVMNELTHLRAVSCTLSVFSSVSYFLLVWKRLFNSMQALTNFSLPRQGDAGLFRQPDDSMAGDPQLHIQ